MDTEFNPVIHARLPRRIMRLEQLAYNLWWSWNRNARDLFKRMDRTLWTTSRHNPVKMLIETSAENLAVLAKDPTFLRQYDAVMMEMDRDLGNGHHWFAQTYPELEGEKIAYLSAEFGLHTSMPIYSGGLGILSGDHNKEASDLVLPFIGVGFLYEQGYFSQRLDPSGWQESIYTDLRQEEVALLPALCKDGTCIRVNVLVGDREVALQVWEVLVGRARLYLMDANVEENAPWDRELTARLYGGDREMRLQQEILLGIGGVKIIRMLDLKPAVWHLNEGHSAFMVLERLKEYVAQGMPWNDAIEHIRAGTVFTTHTPVPAGHDTFSFAQIERYFHSYWSQLGISRDEFMALGSYDNGYGVNFNMTALAMRMSGRINGVSALHGEVSRRMWRSLWPEKAVDATPIGHVTNGVHLASWTGEAMHRIYRQYISPDWLSRQDEPMLWERIEDVPDQVLWDAHVYLKNKLFSAMRERARQSRMQQQASPEHLLASGILLDPDALVIGFARRFATYKRAGLIFRDLERLKALIHHRYRPVQFVFAGKAHPRDDEGKRYIQYILHLSKYSDLHGHLVFIENYDVHVARQMVSGCDVWLNTPRAAVGGLRHQRHEGGPERRAVVERPGRLVDRRLHRRRHGVGGRRGGPAGRPFSGCPLAVREAENPGRSDVLRRQQPVHRDHAARNRPERFVLQYAADASAVRRQGVF